MGAVRVEGLEPRARVQAAWCGRQEAAEDGSSHGRRIYVCIHIYATQLTTPLGSAVWVGGLKYTESLVIPKSCTTSS